MHLREGKRVIMRLVSDGAPSFSRFGTNTPQKGVFGNEKACLSTQSNSLALPRLHSPIAPTPAYNLSQHFEVNTESPDSWE